VCSYVRVQVSSCGGAHVSNYVTAKVCSGRDWEVPQSTGKQLRRCASEQLRK